MMNKRNHRRQVGKQEKNFVRQDAQGVELVVYLEIDVVAQIGMVSTMKICYNK